MAIKYNDTNFLYSSARVRAMENSVISNERLERMTEAKSSSEIIASLPEYGFDVVYDGKDTDKRILVEQTLLSVLKTAYADISNMCGELPVTDFLRYPYDCNNIKAIIKCESRGVDPADMLFDIGTVPPELMAEYIRDKNYSALPKNMAAALPVAIEAFASSSNPQQIDLILDRACFGDMLEFAEGTGVEYIVDLVRTKIDLLNIITCIRIIRMKLYFAAEPMMREAFLEGGTLGADFFISGLEFGAKKLFEELEYTPYRELRKYADEDSPFFTIEVATDNIWLDKAKRARQVTFGAPVLVGYLAALEYEVKNLRMIIAGKDAGLPAQTIKERLRASYV